MHQGRVPSITSGLIWRCAIAGDAPCLMYTSILALAKMAACRKSSNRNDHQNHKLKTHRVLPERWTCMINQVSASEHHSVQIGKPQGLALWH
jgi:hypothetical protein